jgi:hypothetical protein
MGVQEKIQKALESVNYKDLKIWEKKATVNKTKISEYRTNQ